MPINTDLRRSATHVQWFVIVAKNHSRYVDELHLFGERGHKQSAEQERQNQRIAASLAELGAE
jgi:hypothetical protein